MTNLPCRFSPSPDNSIAEHVAKIAATHGRGFAWWTGSTRRPVELDVHPSGEAVFDQDVEDGPHRQDPVADGLIVHVAGGVDLLALGVFLVGPTPVLQVHV